MNALVKIVPKVKVTQFGLPAAFATLPFWTVSHFDTSGVISTKTKLDCIQSKIWVKTTEDNNIQIL